MEKIKQLLGNKKIPFSILNIESELYDPDDDKIIIGKLYIGVSNWNLMSVLPIDDEAPSVISNIIRSH